MKRAIICALLLMILLPFFSLAEGDYSDLKDALPNDVRSLLKDSSPQSVNVKDSASTLFDKAVSLFKEYLKGAVGSGFLILSVSIIVSLAAAFAKDADINIPVKVIDFTSVAAILLLSLSTGAGVISECARSIGHLGTFSDIFIPSFGIATAVAGKPATAIAAAGATMIFSRLIIGACQWVFIPAAYVYIVSWAVGSLSENDFAFKIAEFVKWVSTNFLRWGLIAFTAYLSISNIISGSADAAAVKTAQVTISGVLPVVGNIVSGASESLLAGAMLLRSSVGIFGFLGACAICLVPFVKLLCHVLVFKALAAFSASFAKGAASKVLDGIASAYNFALGLIGACCAVQFISIVVGMVVTNG